MHYLPHTPLAWTAIGLGWILIAAAIATVPHRAKRALQHADPGEDYEPADWTALIPADSLSDGALLRERFDAIVTGDWFDGTLHYTGSLGGAL